MLNDGMTRMKSRGRMVWVPQGRIERGRERKEEGDMSRSDGANHRQRSATSKNRLSFATCQFFLAQLSWMNEDVSRAEKEKRPGCEMNG